MLNKLKQKQIKKNQLSLLSVIHTKSIFIRIPKSGGRSMSNSIYGCLAGSHLKIKDYQIVFNEYDFNSFFKFTIVRNPWDRVVSAYFFLKEGGISKKDKKFSDKYLKNINSFEDFVINHLSKKNIFNYMHFQPQYKFFMINGEIKVDYIGYFEKLNNEFLFIKNKLNSKSSNKLQNLNLTRTRKNKSYKGYYSNKSKKIVSILYSKDIDVLGYTF